MASAISAWRRPAGDIVLEADDLRGGANGLPASDVLRYRLEGDARLVVRPSGTEPKLKAYLDVVSDAATPEERRAATDATLIRLRDGVRTLLG